MQWQGGGHEDVRTRALLGLSHRELTLMTWNAGWRMSWQRKFDGEDMLMEG